ncbi:unnamed protein product [Gongylonema pulchrum]|uniref:Uncharacterized protein n=1 Tax=Gongylonema pulchrum TaxID=637853 RepID=A0A183E1F4_9BILA|nr:unnamed protein product [Gongylonema pulchrum]
MIELEQLLLFTGWSVVSDVSLCAPFRLAFHIIIVNPRNHAVVAASDGGAAAVAAAAAAAAATATAQCASAIRKFAAA